MDTMSPKFTQETENLLVALYSRAHDAQSERPILDDRMAVTVSKGVDYDFGKLKIRDDDAISLAIRGKQIDRWTRHFLADHPEAVVLHLGAGLDGRVFRVDPPADVDWYDVDLPEVAELFRGLYPRRANHHVIGASVIDEGWLEDIPRDRPVLVVAEALLVYFARDQVRDLVTRLVDRFPRGRLIFDAYTPFSVRMMNMHWTVKASGKFFVWGLQDPASLEQWHPKIRHISEWTFTDSPYVATHMPRTSQIVCEIMNAITILRTYNRVLRYDF